MANHPNRSYQPAYRAAELAVILARHYPDARPGWVASVVLEMQRITKAAKRHAEAACSYEWAEQHAAKWAAQEDRAAAMINTRLSTRGFPFETEEMLRSPKSVNHFLHPAPATVTLGGDPRGPCGRLMMPGQRGDGWGEGYAIY